MIINRMDWDSSFFGYEVGKFYVNDKEVFDFLKLKKEAKKFGLVYVFSHDKLIESENFRLVDEKATFIRPIEKDDLQLNSTPGYELCSYYNNKHDVEQLKRLALESGAFSRFNIDPYFRNREYQKLYIHWIENSINKNLAFEIIIASQNNKILGFTTLNRKDEILADIGLVAVDQDCRGKGIGLNLIYKTIYTAANAGYKFIQVVTQLENIPAIKLYEKSKFKLRDVINIYHYWNL